VNTHAAPTSLFVPVARQRHAFAEVGCFDLGEWSLPSTNTALIGGPLDNGLSGGITGIVVTDPSSLPTHPTMPTGLGLIKAIGGLLFGSAGPGDTAGTGHTPAPPSTVTQLADAAGHTLFGPDGKLNTNPATRLQAAPFMPLVGSTARAVAAKGGPPQMILLPPGVGTLHVTVTGTGAGPDTHTMIGRGFAGQIDTQASKGVKDALTLSPGSGEVGFATKSARKPLTLTLVDGVPRERRTAQIATTSFGGAGDALSFTGSHGGLTFIHHGGATTLSLALSALGPKSAPAVFQSGPLHIGAGASVRIGGIRWDSLTGSTLLIRIGRRTIVVHNRARSPLLASIKTLHAKKGRHGTVSLTIFAALHRLPTGAQLAFAWTVRSGGHVVASHAVLKPLGTRSASYTFKPKRKGRYTLTGTVAVVTISGVTESTSSTSRTLNFRV
jgi:hypothetical protein